MDEVFALQSDVCLHRTAGESYIFRQSEVSADKVQFTDLSLMMTRINRIGAEILSCCDGCSSVNDIANQLDTKYPNMSSKEDIFQAVHDFLYQAEEREYVSRNLFTTRGQKTGNFSSYYPVHAVFELTDGCNLSCPHCYRKARRRGYAVAPIEQLLKGLRDLRSNGVRVVEFTGGEPTLHPQFTQIIQSALELFDTVGIISNGTLLRPKEIEQFPNPRNLIVQVDLDGPTAAIHHRVHGGNRNLDAFTPVLAAIRACSTRGIFTRVAVNATPLNLDTIEQTVDMAFQLGASVVGIAPVMPMGRAKNNALMGFSPEQIDQLEHTVHGMALKYPGRLNVVTDAIRQAVGKNCGVGYRTITVAPDGSVRPCTTTWQTDVLPSIGNLFYDDFDLLFGSPQAHALATLPAPVVDTCGNCSYIRYCEHCVARGLEPKTGTMCQWKNKYANLIQVLQHPSKEMMS